MKSVRIKRIVAAMVTATVVLSTSACSKSGTQTTNTQAQSNAIVTNPLEKYPSPVTITASRIINNDFKYLGGETIDNNTWIKMYKDELNIDIKDSWVTDQTQATTKMNIAIASGDYPDIFTVSISDYKKYADSGVIADITSLFDKYQTDHMKAVLNADNGDALKSIKVDGKIYGIPGVTNPNDGANALFLRKDWLTKLDLSAPKTVADLEKVADAFTNQDPDGNGKKDTYGLAVDGKDVVNWFGGVEPFFEMYGAYPLGYQSSLSLVKDSSGKQLVWGGSLPGMKPALTELQKFYKNGWIAQELGTMDYNKTIAEVTAGHAGMYFAPYFGAQTAQDAIKTNPKADFVAVAIPGVDANTPGKAFVPSSLNNVMVVSSKCKNPEALFKMYGMSLDKVAFAKDADTFNMYGGDSVKYSGWKVAVLNPLLPTKNYDNYSKVYAAVEKKDGTGLNPNQLVYFNGIMNDYLGKPVDPSSAAYVNGFGWYKTYADPNGGYVAVDKMIKANNLVKDGFSGAPTSNMSTKASSLTDLTKTSIIKIIYGTSTPDSWDSVVSDWKALGGNDVLKDANDWLKSIGN